MTTTLDALSAIQTEITATLAAIDSFPIEQHPDLFVAWGHHQKCAIGRVENSFRFLPADRRLIEPMATGSRENVERFASYWNGIVGDPERFVEAVDLPSFLAMVKAECIATRALCHRLRWTGESIDG